MNILLIAINAKYIHSNLAVYSLKAYASEYSEHIQIAEYTINHYTDDILQDIYKKNPDVIAFSCYIWNLEQVKILIEDLPKILPDTDIWMGGPEVSYDAEEFLRDHPGVKGIMRGEGEKTFSELSRYYTTHRGSLEQINGITYHNGAGDIINNDGTSIMKMDEIPFMYEDMEDFTNKIVYYESSRGCPFSCSYCLSSIDKRLRFRSLDRVNEELQFFLDNQVPQVKFVDRTFNCNHKHAMGIWTYIKEHDNGMTNFHFEIAADLLNEEELRLLNSLRPGLVQLEIGVQSTNPDTIREIDRTMDFEILRTIVERIHTGNNIHQHLDLIAGLPYEDYESFCCSFNDVYSLKPDQLQLGFLKVLKGSKMHGRSLKYGVFYKEQPPYEVLSTKWLAYGELVRLKGVEEMVEIYYNSHQFACTLEKLEELFQSPFELYSSLARFHAQQGLSGQKYTRIGRLEHLRDFALTLDAENIGMYEELLTLDLYLRENSKSRPGWAGDRSTHKKEMYEFYQSEEKEPSYLRDYEGCNYKQLAKMTHFEVFRHPALGELLEYRQQSVSSYTRQENRRNRTERCKKDMIMSEKMATECYVAVFDYRHRSPLNQDAKVYVIRKSSEVSS